MKVSAVMLGALTTFIVTGCSIKQEIKPVGMLESKEVCIIQNPAVLNNFLPVYQQALIEKGYKPILKQSPDNVNVCPITSTYTANWRWDMALYMAYANIKVYKNGVLSGEATYDSLSGSANMGKFINGETKIKELVGQLYP
jgi:hypothetical protein